MIKARHVTAMSIVIFAGALLPLIGLNGTWPIGDWPVFVPASILGGFTMRTWLSPLILPIAYTVGVGFGAMLVDGIVDTFAVFVGGAVFVAFFFFIPHLFTMLLPTLASVVAGKIIEARGAESSMHRFG